MNCNEYIIWISGHIDGTNSKKDEQLLQAHLTSCPQCRQVMAEMKANEAVLKEHKLIPPGIIANNVMDAIRKDAKQKNSKRLRSYIFSVAAVAAVLCLVLISSLKTPSPTTENPGVRSLDMPHEAVMISENDSETIPSAFDGEEADATMTYGAVSTIASNHETKSVAPQKDGPCHCVFVELPSQDEMPETLQILEPEDFSSRITADAREFYNYCGSAIYGATIMPYDEMAEWESLIQFRFSQDLQTEDYVVVFCSEIP